MFTYKSLMLLILYNYYLQIGVNYVLLILPQVYHLYIEQSTKNTPKIVEV